MSARVILRRTGSSVLLLFVQAFFCSVGAAEPADDILITRVPTTCYRQRGGRLEAECLIPQSTLLRLDPGPSIVYPAVNGAGSYRHTWFIAPNTTQAGWVYDGAVANLSELGRRWGETDPTKIAGLENERRKLPAIVAHQPESIRKAYSDLDAVIQEYERPGRKQLPEPYFARAELWRLMHNFDDAMKDYLKATGLAMTPEVDFVDRSKYFVRLHRSLGQFDRMPKPPYLGEANVHYGHGLYAFYDGRLEEALEQFNDAIQLKPDEPEFWYFRALTYKRLGREDRALHDVRIGVYLEQDAMKRLRGGRDPSIDKQFVRVQGPIRNWIDGFRTGDPATRLSGL